jgi:hypothetical protein
MQALRSSRLCGCFSVAALLRSAVSQNCILLAGFIFQDLGAIQPIENLRYVFST